MATEGIDYHKEKSRRNWKFKAELTDYERNLKHFNELLERANTLLIIIAMILFGLFVHFVFGGG